jgi:hypothetical protein
LQICAHRSSPRGCCLCAAAQQLPCRARPSARLRRSRTHLAAVPADAAPLRRQTALRRALSIQSIPRASFLETSRAPCAHPLTRGRREVRSRFRLAGLALAVLWSAGAFAPRQRPEADGHCRRTAISRPMRGNFCQDRKPPIASKRAVRARTEGRGISGWAGRQEWGGRASA